MTLYFDIPSNLNYDHLFAIKRGKGYIRKPDLEPRDTSVCGNSGGRCPCLSAFEKPPVLRRAHQ